MLRLPGPLESEKPLTDAVTSQADEKLDPAFAFLTLKPTMVVVNVDEDKLAAAGRRCRWAATSPSSFPPRSRRNWRDLPDAEQKEFMEDLGVSRPPTTG